MLRMAENRRTPGEARLEARHEPLHGSFGLRGKTEGTGSVSCSGARTTSFFGAEPSRGSKRGNQVLSRTLLALAAHSSVTASAGGTGQRMRRFLPVGVDRVGPGGLDRGSRLTAQCVLALTRSTEHVRGGLTAREHEPGLRLRLNGEGAFLGRLPPALSHAPSPSRSGSFSPAPPTQAETGPIVEWGSGGTVSSAFPGPRRKGSPPPPGRRVSSPPCHGNPWLRADLLRDRSHDPTPERSHHTGQGVLPSSPRTSSFPPPMLSARGSGSTPRLLSWAAPGLRPTVEGLRLPRAPEPR